MGNELMRCGWAKSDLEMEYHDNVWGKPMHDDHELFKKLILDGQQAGLSWSIILKKMNGLCAAYDDFDPYLLASYDARKIDALLNDDRVIKNRAKVNAAVHNAKCYFTLCEEFGSLDAFLWRYVEGKTIMNHWKELNEVPATSPISDVISRDLKKFGFKFVGSTIVYAYMQAIGMVNDHLVYCSFR